MAFGRFQDFLSGLVKRQRRLFSGSEAASIDELLKKLMGTVGEVSGIVTARQVLDHYEDLDDERKLAFFQNLEQNFNANQAVVKLAFDTYENDPSSANLNNLSKAAEPQRHELLRRLNSTPNATHDLVAMRTDLLKLLRDHPELRAVDQDFVRMFSSWFGRGFLVLKTINWSTSAAILERIIRYEAVHAIKDWDDLRSRIDPSNRRCFAYFHPALIDEPLIFVEVALTKKIPTSINSILEDNGAGISDPSEYNTATFYSISNCQPGLKNISFGNFLIKQVVQELQAEFPSLKTFVTLSPIPGFGRWLNTQSAEELAELAEMKERLGQVENSAESTQEHAAQIRKLVFNYLVQAKRGKFPSDSVARFHLGNGASVHQLHTGADLSEKGLKQSWGTMVNYLYDLASIETNHEHYATNGDIEFNDKLKSLLIKA
ncbi:MAG: malonyl-CoA decarboxylase [Proteobacteria bacterium]|nr:malonyl-CoA decarboxylase [Pseudomonadota bacterium]